MLDKPEETTNTTTTKPEYVPPAFFGELALPEYPQEQGRRAHELVRVVATFADNGDMEKVQASYRVYVQLPEAEYDFPPDDGVYWGENLAGIAWAIANDESVFWKEMPPLKMFDKICGIFFLKAAQIAAHEAAQEAPRKVAREAKKAAQEEAQKAQKAAQEEAQKATRQWITDVVEKAAAGSRKEGAAR